MKEYQKYLTEIFGMGRKSNPTVEDVYDIIFKWGEGLAGPLISRRLMKKLGLDEMKAGEIEGIIMMAAEKVFEENKEDITKVTYTPDYDKKVFTKNKPYKLAFVDKEQPTPSNFADLMYDLGLPDKLRKELETKIKAAAYDEIQEVLNR